MIIIYKKLAFSSYHNTLDIVNWLLHINLHSLTFLIM